MSRHIGDFEELLGQLNLSQKGLVKGPYEQKIIVTSGDIICDLISGDARMSMTYPIDNRSDNQQHMTKVVYQPLEVKLSSNS